MTGGNNLGSKRWKEMACKIQYRPWKAVPFTLGRFDVADPLLTLPELMVAELMKNHGGWINKACANTSRETLDMIKSIFPSLNAVWKSDKKISPKSRPNVVEGELELSRSGDDHTILHHRGVLVGIVLGTILLKNHRNRMQESNKMAWEREVHILVMVKMIIVTMMLRYKPPQKAVAKENPWQYQCSKEISLAMKLLRRALEQP
jgi:hypothetical protein